MPDFLTRLAAALDRTTDHLPLATVPVLFALLNADKIAAVASFDGFHVGFKLGLPVSVVTVWQFVAVPGTGVSVWVGPPVDRLPFAVVVVPVLVVVRAAVTAGYFGACRNALAGEPYAFVAGARRHFWPFLVLTGLPVALLLPFALSVVGAGPAVESLGPPVATPAVVALLVPVLVVALVFAYLFFAVPYLVVLRDTGLVAAARGSYTLATAGGPYLAYAASFAGFVLLVSPVATVLVVTVPVVGLPVGVLVGSVLGLTANLATMRFVADVDPDTAVGPAWNDADEPAG